MEEKQQTKILTVRFANKLDSSELEYFRGAINNATESPDVLFHNHLEDGKLRYKYPLIQYKCINGKAAIVCLNKGTEAIGQLFASCRFDVQIGKRPVTLEVESMKADQVCVQVSENMFTYRISDWLALNPKNYKKYRQTERLVERDDLLEGILKGNILSFAKGLDIRFEKLVKCVITTIDSQRVVKYKGNKLMAFDAVFKTNVNIPDYVGLGKGVSLGHGVVTKKHEDAEFEVSQHAKVFLLGGHDLEMKTIRELLGKQMNCVIKDHNLAWDNAKLSAYREEIGQYSMEEIYAVELQQDIELPAELIPRFHRIDHHNDMNGLPSSLEQVAAIFDVVLNRFQKLVAANDSGYIPAMKALQATEEEVAMIRRLDRETQGVTEEDELLAEKSLERISVRSDNLVVVKSLTSKFSPICDRLFPYKRLLIYTDSEWVFYGEGKSELVQCYGDAIQQGIIYHGGGENGFVGSVKGKYTQNEIEQFVESIKSRYE